MPKTPHPSPLHVLAEGIVVNDHFMGFVVVRDDKTHKVIFCRFIHSVLATISKIIPTIQILNGLKKMNLLG